MVKKVGISSPPFFIHEKLLRDAKPILMPNSVSRGYSEVPDKMNIVTLAALFIGLAPIGPGHAQGTMSGMTNSTHSSPLMAPTGQGQGPHDIGKEPGATANHVRGRNREVRPESSSGMNPGKSSMIPGSGEGINAISGSEGGERDKVPR